MKWSVLIHLAKMKDADSIQQITYFREDNFSGVEIDGGKFDIPSEIEVHFRDIRRIEGLSSPPKVSVFGTVFENRKEYLYQAKEFITSFSNERCIVFLDLDTGLEPPKTKPNLDHVLSGEIRDFWHTLKPGDLLALYQHKTNRNDEAWKEPKRKQFQKAIRVAEGTVMIAHGPKLASDVILIYAQKA